MNPLNKHIAAVVRASRRNAGLTQESVAHTIGRTAESISNIERGDSIPTFETLLKLSDALSISVSSFVPNSVDAEKSRERLRREAEAEAIIRNLDDRSLLIAISQLGALG